MQRNWVVAKVEFISWKVDTFSDSFTTMKLWFRASNLYAGISAGTQTLLLRISMIFCRRFSEMTLDTYRSNGRLFHLYQPYGVLKVASGLNSLPNSNCRIVLLWPTFVKRVEHTTLGRMSSKTGNGHRSLVSTMFDGCGSMHIRRPSRHAAQVFSVPFELLKMQLLNA